VKVEEDKFSFSSCGDGGELDCSVCFKIEFKKVGFVIGGSITRFACLHVDSVSWIQGFGWSRSHHGV